MPENASGPSGMPTHGDSQQGIKDTLARLEAKIDRLAEQLADAEAEAEEIMRRATAPTSRPRHATPHRHRGGTFLYVVKAAVVATACLAALVALMSPARAHRERFTPACTVRCSHPVAHVDRDGDYDGG